MKKKLIETPMFGVAEINMKNLLILLMIIPTTSFATMTADQARAEAKKNRIENADHKIGTYIRLSVENGYCNPALHGVSTLSLASEYPEYQQIIEKYKKLGYVFNESQGIAQFDISWCN